MTTETEAVRPSWNRRMSRPCEREVVPRLLRGEDLELVLRGLGETSNQSWIIERHGYRTTLARVRADQRDRVPMAG